MITKVNLRNTEFMLTAPNMGSNIQEVVKVFREYNVYFTAGTVKYIVYGERLRSTYPSSIPVRTLLNLSEASFKVRDKLNYILHGNTQLDLNQITFTPIEAKGVDTLNLGQLYD